MLLSNCLFRMGGAAILLSNKIRDRRRSKYKLLHTVRINKAASDVAYEAVYQCEDDKGITGVRLSRDLIKVVGDALRSNLTILGPLVLPLSEQATFFAVMIVRHAVKAMSSVGLGWAVERYKDVKPYTPLFTKAFDHICIHSGGRAVIDGMEQNLSLTKRHVEASRAVLYR
jgi:3-ketoacyl-CoA synthase